MLSRGYPDAASLPASLISGLKFGESVSWWSILPDYRAALDERYEHSETAYRLRTRRVESPRGEEPRAE
jgi:hypothetical protein